MATKSYYIGPQDGWKEVIVAGAAFSVRISAYPHTHPFFVYGDPNTIPNATDNGVYVCHHPFEVQNSSSSGNLDSFYVRVQNPFAGSKNRDGRIRIDVYIDGEALA